MPEPKRRNISQKSEMVYDLHHFGINIDTREIFLSSDLDYDYNEAMLDHRAANKFVRNLQILNSLSDGPILVHMITCGGDWNYGMAIYDAIKTSKSDIIILAYAHARSMSSIIPQAAKWRVMMPNADFLIHDGTLGFDDMNYQSVVSEVKWSEKGRERMLDVYVERCREGQFFLRENMDDKAIKEWLIDKINKKQEFYLTSREAVDYGFMDAVLGDDEFESISSLREE
jgi:ATP-dependent protease ClpP protease subunit